jgi:hypothetical protein
MKALRRWALVAAAVASGVAALALAEDPAPPESALHPPAVVHRAPAQRAAPAGTDAAPRIDLERLRRVIPVASAREDGAAFDARSWFVPPPPPRRAPPPPPSPSPSPQLDAAPTPPPLPFTYLGRYEDAPTRLVMLIKGERIHTVSQGDVIEGTHRVDRIADNHVELTYLPLDARQSLSIGAAP